MPPPGATEAFARELPCAHASRRCLLTAPYARCLSIHSSRISPCDCVVSGCTRQLMHCSPRPRLSCPLQQHGTQPYAAAFLREQGYCCQEMSMHSKRLHGDFFSETVSTASSRAPARDTQTSVASEYITTMHSACYTRFRKVSLHNEACKMPAQE